MNRITVAMMLFSLAVTGCTRAIDVFMPSPSPSRLANRRALSSRRISYVIPVNRQAIATPPAIRNNVPADQPQVQDYLLWFKQSTTRQSQMEAEMGSAFQVDAMTGLPIHPEDNYRASQQMQAYYSALSNLRATFTIKIPPSRCQNLATKYLEVLDNEGQMYRYKIQQIQTGMTSFEGQSNEVTYTGLCASGTLRRASTRAELINLHSKFLDLPASLFDWPLQ